MNDTRIDPPAGDAFASQRLRSITDIHRGKDRMIGGVSTGAARYLNIDPVVVRIAFVALAFIGCAGIVLYLGAWLLLPVEDTRRSIASRWFRLSGKAEEQVRIIGLVVTGVVALAAAFGEIGDGPANWFGPGPWFGLVVIGLIYFLVVRPRQQRDQTSAVAVVPPSGGVPPVADAPSDVATTTQLPLAPYAPRPPKTPWSPALTLITLSTALIALGALWVYDELEGGVPWTTYVVVALGVVAAGLLVGTFFGNGGLLVLLGIPLALSLAFASVLPDASIGQRHYAPSTASEVKSAYRLGVGDFRLDLRDVADPSSLRGRTITIESGLGSTEVLVPRDLAVDVETSAKGGELIVFDRSVDGGGIDLDYDDPDRTAPTLTIEIEQGFGQVRVNRS